MVVLEQRRETDLGVEKREKTEEREGVELTGYGSVNLVM